MDVFRVENNADTGSEPLDRAPIKSGPIAEVTVVVPVMNSIRYLDRTVPTLLAAGRRHGSAAFVFVDNGSTDGSYEYLIALSSARISVYRRVGDTIAGLRNFGASRARGPYISFIDSDCAVPESYFVDAVAFLESTGAFATGCEVHIPEAPHWIEATWHDLHYVGRDRDVAYLNSGNFFVSRAAFEAVKGFRSDMWTGEDAELGKRLTAAGYRIRASARVTAYHLGNPKSVREFYRRTVWHGLGMFGTVSFDHIDRPTAMMLSHLAAAIAGIFILARGPNNLWIRGLAFIALQLLVPALTVAYRARRTRVTRRAGAGLFLYWLYYWARLQALFVVLGGGASKYRK
jgi:glycosyltransferase involved in cell wall biosynthesis